MLRAAMETEEDPVLREAARYPSWRERIKGVVGAIRGACESTWVFGGWVDEA
jgi:hypothetical protein